nr:integrase, catalytic region, zinc finger, CCHC-type, peptidase aspartic, catalytic [Tanacetum cinerariifolium]GFB37816.1 integrase, catalytic region, zinc finger, CCHC-type, peptidase aspartic, catalytic [Tanacetum cinerariifolium]
MYKQLSDSIKPSREKVFVITTLKNNLRKLKRKDVVDNGSQMSNATTIAPGMYKLDPIILAPQVKNNTKTHEYYLKHTTKQAARSKPSTSASGSKTSCNTKNDRISQTPSSNEKNKVEVQSRKVKFKLNKQNSDSKNVYNEHVKHHVKGAQDICYVCNECLFDANHAMCLIDHVNSMNARDQSTSKKNKNRKEWEPTGKVFNSIGYKWKPTRRTFTLVGNACPLTRITATNKVPLRVPIPLEVVAPEHVHMTRDHSQLTNFVYKFLGTVKFGNDQVAKIIGYGEYQIGNVTILRVYYVEGLGYNLFSVGCDSDLEVAFRKHNCFVRNLEGVDLLLGSRRNNMYSLSIREMMVSSPV